MNQRVWAKMKLCDRLREISLKQEDYVRGVDPSTFAPILVKKESRTLYINHNVARANITEYWKDWHRIGSSQFPCINFRMIGGEKVVWVFDCGSQVAGQSDSEYAFKDIEANINADHQGTHIIWGHPDKE